MMLLALFSFNIEGGSLKIRKNLYNKEKHEKTTDFVYNDER